jgi:aminoglycoside 2'-N-acetyltransferase I
MVDLQFAHTALLSPEVLAQTRAFLAGAFPEEFTNYDWENAIGGLHALLWERAELIGHASVIQRRLLYGDLALRAGYFECVGVRADRRLRGHGTKMMEALQEQVRNTYDISALCSTSEAIPFYSKLGWRVWGGPLLTLTPSGLRNESRYRNRICILEHSLPLDLDAPLACDWRTGDPWE